MEGKRPLGLETPYRDPRIRISNRRCGLCNSEATPALVIKFIGELDDEVFFCISCVIKGSYELAARRDFIIKIETLPRGGGGIIHA